MRKTNTGWKASLLACILMTAVAAFAAAPATAEGHGADDEKQSPCELVIQGAEPVPGQGPITGSDDARPAWQFLFLECDNDFAVLDWGLHSRPINDTDGTTGEGPWVNYHGEFENLVGKGGFALWDVMIPDINSHAVCFWTHYTAFDKEQDQMKEWFADFCWNQWN